MGAEGSQRRREPLMDGAVGGTQGAEPIHGRGDGVGDFVLVPHRAPAGGPPHDVYSEMCDPGAIVVARGLDRKSTRLNSSHLVISYAVFCLKKKKTNNR